MALVLCMECGKSISDKAASCPGCGCPLGSVSLNLIDFRKLNKEKLWFKAYDLHYKGKKSDLPLAIEMYKYIINTFGNSNEANYASAQLKILSDNNATIEDTIDDKLYKSDSTMQNSMTSGEYLSVKCLKCGKYTTTEESQITKEYDGHATFNEGGCSCGNDIHFMVSDSCSVNASRSCSEIPTHGGLASLAFIMGFGVLGGVVLGSHLKTKKLIAKGEYDAALQASSTTFWGAMMIIVGMPILAVIIIFGMPH